MKNEDGFISLVDTSDNKDFQTIDMPTDKPKSEIKKNDIENNIKSVSSNDINDDIKRPLNTINEPIIETIVNTL